jgi:hypothetical protein
MNSSSYRFWKICLLPHFGSSSQTFPNSWKPLAIIKSTDYFMVILLVTWGNKRNKVFSYFPCFVGKPFTFYWNNLVVRVTQYIQISLFASVLIAYLQCTKGSFLATGFAQRQSDCHVRTSLWQYRKSWPLQT